MTNSNITEIEKEINLIEIRIEENEDYIDTDEFNDSLLDLEERIRWEKDGIEGEYSSSKFSEKGDNILSNQLKTLEKLSIRLNQIKDDAGIESEEDIRGFMFPDGEDDL